MITSEGLQNVNKALQSIDVKGKGYVQVTERVKAFRALCPNGTITTDIIKMDGEVVVMKATVSDGESVLATGLAYEKETSSYINKTSYIENCETSAVGRALGFCGIGIDGSMCSAEELVNAIRQQETMEQPASQKISKAKADALTDVLLQVNMDVHKLLDQYHVANVGDLTEQQHNDIVKRLRKAGKI